MTSPWSAISIRSIRIAAIPLASWAYALRIWAAMMLSLYACFWLQLQGASTAAVTVSILAQPRRGEALRKALSRFAATLVGTIASLVLVSLFTQSRDLFIVAFAAWMALAVYVSAFFDGNRAYGAVLSGFTVAVVALPQIDSPQNLFIDGVNRLAVIFIGIAAIAFINDLLAAPDVTSGLLQRLRQADAQLHSLSADFTTGAALPTREIIGLLSLLTGLRLDIQAASTEDGSSSRRADAAASATVALIGGLSRLRVLDFLSRSAPADAVEVCRMAIGQSDAAFIARELEGEWRKSERSPRRVALYVVTAKLLDSLQLARDELQSMQTGRRATRRVAMPIHRSREAAIYAAIRVFLVVVVTGYLFVLSGWPLTSDAWLIVGVLAGLSATVPDPAAFAKGAALTIPLAIVAAGLVEYLILDGADAFPLLCIGMAPPVIVGCLLSLNKKTMPIGLLLLIFVPLLFAPSNPQNYSEQTFVLESTLIFSGALLFATLIRIILPVTVRDRRHWLIRQAQRDMFAAMQGTSRRPVEDLSYLCADRIVALSRMRGLTDAARDWSMRYTLLLSYLTLVAGQGRTALASLPDTTATSRVARDARQAFGRLDAAALDRCADDLLGQAPESGGPHARAIAQVVADLHTAAVLITRRPTLARYLRTHALP